MATEAAAPPEGDPPALLEEAGNATEFSPDPGSATETLQNFKTSTVEIDLEADPLSSPVSSSASRDWDVEFLSRFSPRVPESPDMDRLKHELSALLTELEAGPEISAMQEEQLTAWLDSVETKVHPVERFVAGSFSRHLPVSC